MDTKKQCPDCGRHFSERLIKFPVFLDDRDETEVYMICPLCAFEKRTKKEKTVSSDHSKDLYKEALLEAEVNGELEKKSPVSNEELIFEKLTKLTPEEYDLVLKNHPEFEEDEKN